MMNAVRCHQQKHGFESANKHLITVLHVDDDEDFQICFKRYLEKQGKFKVENAFSADDAIQKIGQKQFDVIVSDHQMPKKTGIDFLKQLKQLQNDIPFFLLTGDPRNQTLTEALESGAYRVFNKNSSSETLYLELAHSIQQSVKNNKTQESKNELKMGDITGQQQELLKAVSRGLDVEILVVSRDYRILWSNIMSKENRTDLLDKNCYEVFQKKSCVCNKCGVQQIFEENKDRVVVQKQANVFGKPEIWIESTITPVKNEQGKIIAALEIIVPITKRKNAENARKESENKFRAITESAKDGVILINEKGKIDLWNPAAEKIFGYTKEDVIGKDVHTIATSKKYKRYHEAMLQFVSGKGKYANKRFEFDGLKKDGKSVPIEVSLSPVKLKGKMHALAIVRDSTERKTAWTSLEQTIDELVKINEKLGVLSRLTRHDARNKLSVILNNIYLARRTSNKQPQTEMYLQEIESVVDQMTKIFDFASHYEKLGIEELTHNSVEKRFKEAATLSSSTQNIQFVSECDDLFVLADSLLRQLFYNMIHNSLNHGTKVNQIKIHYKEESDQLKLFYEDNGSGIAANEKNKIFKEGYGKGTGFGLYLIRKTCEAYGWTIQETGVPSKGAQFVISIPKESKEGKPSYKFEHTEARSS
jgi:PAS domain S-box-containing protein